jgi:integrase
LTPEQARNLARDTLVEVAKGGDPSEGATALAAIKFLLLTGLRRTEALALPRTCVDMKAHCIRFDDTKTGPQIRPIGYEAVKLVRELPQQDGCPLGVSCRSRRWPPSRPSEGPGQGVQAGWHFSPGW